MSARPGTAPRVARQDGKRIAARAFDRACRASGLTNTEIGAALNLDERRIRRLRSDDETDLDVVPSSADLVLAPHELGERFLHELRVERLALHGTSPAITPEQKLHRAMAATSRFGAVSCAALENGVIEPHEVPDIEHERADAHRQLDELGAIFHGRKDLIR